MVALDADTRSASDDARLARWLGDEPLAAVAGNAKVGNRVNIVTKWQALEYITAQNLERRALARLGAMTVVPGAVGAWRKQAILEVGGYPPETLAEDQDLTIAVQRAGWKVAYDQSAIAWTEAPQSVRQLARQRFRWAYGTIQCVWKHKRVIASGRPRGLAFIGLPQTILFQLMFALVSPIIDLALVMNIFWTVSSIQEHGYTAMKGDLHRGRALSTVSAIDLTAGDCHGARAARELAPHRLAAFRNASGYRQIMYYVVIKASCRRFGARASVGPQSRDPGSPHEGGNREAAEMAIGLAGQAARCKGSASDAMERTGAPLDSFDHSRNSPIITTQDAKSRLPSVR